MSNKLIKATKVIRSTPETAQLETFIFGLGIEEKAELYMYGNNAYINANIVLPILSVDIKWLIKNSESPVHYITINKKIYINKYGLTKLLAHSKEAVAFQLQDYIYEVIYKLEKTGYVSKDDIVSRTELNKTLMELNVYKSVEEQNKSALKELTDELRNLRHECDVLEDDNAMLKEKYKDLLDEHNKLDEKFNKLVEISKKIAKYVRSRSKKPNVVDDLYTTSVLEIENSDEEYEDDESTYKIDEKSEHSAALKAKLEMGKLIKKPEKTDSKTNKPANKTASKTNKPTSKTNKTTSKTNKTTDNLNNSKMFHIMRSSESTLCNDTGEEYYKWSITDTIPSFSKDIIIDNEIYKDFLEYSNAFRLGDISTILYSTIWYNSILLNTEQEKILSVVLDKLNYISEEFLLDLINSLSIDNS